jgi:ribosomal protein S18 acetylase RimI-like enzyme
MTTTPKQGVYKKWTLTDADLAEIRQLAQICQEHQPLELRLNWDALALRNGSQANEHLYYRDDTRIGFFSMDGLGFDEAEGTGMVHPSYRRQGVFRALVAAACEECRQNNTQSLILFFDHRSDAAIAFCNAIGAQHDFSEHNMRLDDPNRLPQVEQRLDFRKATQADAPAIGTIQAQDFNADPERVQQNVARNMQSPFYRYYIATLDQVPIGTLNVQNIGGEAYIYGFVVRPDQRGRGYGKEILARTIADIVAERSQPVFLEVETENDPAFGLYRSFGFQVTTTYDYYRLPTAKELP